MRMIDMKRLYRAEQKTRLVHNDKRPMPSLKEFIRSKMDEIEHPTGKLRDVLGLPNPQRDELRKKKAEARKREQAARRFRRRTKAANKGKKPKKQKEEKERR